MKRYLRDGESAGPGAVVGVEGLRRQNPLAPADVGEVHPEVAPGANPGLAPLPPPRLFHRPLIEAQHLGLPRRLAAPRARLPARLGARFGFRREVRVLPQLVILQGVVRDLRDVVGLDPEMKLPPDPRGRGRRVLRRRGGGPVSLERRGHAVRLVDGSVVGVEHDVRQVGRREALLAPLLSPSRPGPHFELRRDHELLDVPGAIQRRRHIPRLPRAFLERGQSYVPQRSRERGVCGGRSVEEKPRGGRGVARPSETPRLLLLLLLLVVVVGAGPLKEKMKRGEEYDLRLLEGG